MVLKYSWGQLLIIPFGIKEKVEDAMVKVERWVREEGDGWCEDGDLSDDEYEDDGDGDHHSGSDQTNPSYMIIGCFQSRIQGPSVYVLVAGATDNLDISVEDWNTSHAENCLRIRFQNFGEQKIRRRNGMLTFLRGLLEVGCLCRAQVYQMHQLSERELRAQRVKL
jgi:hypothetical protein